MVIEIHRKIFDFQGIGDVNLSAWRFKDHRIINDVIQFAKGGKFLNR